MHLSQTARLLLCLAMGSWIATDALAAKDPSQAGAYCPLPKKGEVPRCLAPAQEEYSGFFLGLKEGEVDEAAVARVEADLKAGAESDRRFEALSSLSYGYFVLAQAATSEGKADPKTQRRLERWNRLLTQTYRESEEDPRYRDAVREAAVDLNQNVPALGLTCRDGQGRATRCNSTEEVIRAIDVARQETGLRGALSRLLRALFGTEEG